MNLIVIQTMNNGVVARQLVNYSTMDEATGALYNTLASSVANEDLQKVITMIADDNLSCLKFEAWNRESAKGVRK